MAGEAERRVKEMEAKLTRLRLSNAAELEQPLQQFSQLLGSVHQYHQDLFSHPVLSNGGSSKSD